MATDEELDDDIEKMLLGLAKYMGRLPNEDEVMTFVYGTEQQRLEILNGDAVDHPHEEQPETKPTGV